MEYIGDTDRTLQFLVLYKEKTAVLSPSGEAGEGGGGGGGWGGGVGGGGAAGGCSTKFYTGRLRPKVQPLTPFIFLTEKVPLPFVYLLLTNGTPSTHLV